MTAITSLESVHKKGIFGDHQKKVSKELLQVSEIKKLTIVQVFHYKKSKIELKNIKIDGVELPEKKLLVSSNQETRILWNGPRTWLIISNKENIINTITKNCNSDNFAVTDISHSRAVIQIKGVNAKEVLKKGCPIDINELRKNHCANTIFNGIALIVDCIDDETNTFNLFALRSFGESFYHHITDAALEFGYVGV